jgi:hypothetical protein
MTFSFLKGHHYLYFLFTTHVVDTYIRCLCYLRKNWALVQKTIFPRVPSTEHRFGAMGIYQWVAMDSIKFNQGSPCPTLLCPTDRLPQKHPYCHFRGGPPAAFFYPFRYPLPYAYGSNKNRQNDFSSSDGFLIRKKTHSVNALGVRCGVSKGEEDHRKVPACRA